MKYYTIVFPGEFGQHVQETWTREQILKFYWTSWNRKMFQANKGDDVTEDNCIDDWIITHWAVETDEFGNKTCSHPNATREEHLTGEGAMEYVEWYDYTCTTCGKRWTENE